MEKTSSSLPPNALDASSPPPSPPLETTSPLLSLVRKQINQNKMNGINLKERQKSTEMWIEWEKKTIKRIEKGELEELKKEYIKKCALLISCNTVEDAYRIFPDGKTDMPPPPNNNGFKKIMLLVGALMLTYTLIKVNCLVCCRFNKCL